MSEKIYFAIPAFKDKFDELSSILDGNFLIYKNAQDQEELLNLLIQATPEYVIVQRDLPGEKSFKEFFELVNTQFPFCTYIYWNDNSEEIIKMVNGEMEIPHFEIYESESEIENKEYSDSMQAVIDEEKKEKEQEEHKQKVWERITDIKVPTSEKNRSIAIAGFNGGNGKTEIAINFSAWLNKCSYKVALLGFNLQNDDLAERLGIERQSGKGLLAAHELFLVDELSINALRDVLYTYHEGFDVLVGPEYPEDSEYMDSSFFEALIDVLKDEYDFVIIDTESNGYSIAWLPVLQKVDNILFPCSTHVSDLYHLQRGIKNLKDRYNIPISKCDIIHNKAGEGGHIDEDIIMKNTNLECIATLPYSKEILRSAENEKPAVYDLKAKKVKKAMDQLLFRYAPRKDKKIDQVKPLTLRFKKGVKQSAKHLKSIG
ncbi:AAA family ATPase [Margalitia sp. FSL K6-0131]|uniref:AAA family ATPase n=1 Tax=Margalitia sp. FSL K6-0131 TaxID=2954604 RepID=UPI0030F75061